MRYYSLNAPPMSPLSRVLASILGLLAVVGAFFFGLFILAVVIGLGALAWIGLAIRTWWLKRQGLTGAGDDIIEAEYTVISRQEPRDPEA